MLRRVGAQCRRCGRFFPVWLPSDRFEPPGLCPACQIYEIMKESDPDTETERCAACGKPLEPRQHTFCTDACMEWFKAHGDEVRCVVCGKAAKEKHMECKGDGEWVCRDPHCQKLYEGGVTGKCAYCGGPLYGRKGVWLKGSGKRFCSGMHREWHKLEYGSE